MQPLDADACEKIDEALRDWRQGDCVIGDGWFVFRVDPNAPLTQDAAAAADEQADYAESSVFGFAVVSQTCDVVRKCKERPFVEVCPLVEVDEAAMRLVERCHRPSLAFVPGLTDRRLVADLDRVMTVEKAVVAGWERIAGCAGGDDARRFALALSRKRTRVAFPDDFVAFVEPLKDRMSSKHDKESSEGEALRALREVRVRAAPSWGANEVELMFWFIRDEDARTFDGQGWDLFLQQWLERILPRDRFVKVDGLVQTLADLTAREYVESDPLDLDYLSTRES